MKHILYNKDLLILKTKAKFPVFLVVAYKEPSLLNESMRKTWKSQDLEQKMLLC